MKIMVDPGHGGDDNGAAYGDKFDYLEEDDLNLAIAFLLRYRLMLEGHEVHMTRETDEAVSLGRRCALANSWLADLFVSIHADAWHSQTTSGISTHIYPHCTPRTITLGRVILEDLTEVFPDHVSRGLKKSDFQVLRGTGMPAVLIECEFVSNPDQRRFLKEPFNQLSIACAIAQGIHDFGRGSEDQRSSV